MHDFIHDKRRPCHITGVFHERDEKIQNKDIREEYDNASHTTYDTVYEQVFQRSGFHEFLDEAAQPSHTRFDPFHWISSEYESRFEHNPHQEQENGKSVEFMGYQRVDQTRGFEFISFARDKSLSQCTRNKSVFFVSNDGFCVFTECFFYTFIFCIA